MRITEGLHFPSTGGGTALLVLELFRKETARENNGISSRQFEPKHCMSREQATKPYPSLFTAKIPWLYEGISPCFLILLLKRVSRGKKQTIDSERHGEPVTG